MIIYRDHHRNPGVGCPPWTPYLEVDAVGSRGRTALAELARQSGDISLAKMLIDRGANSLTGAEKGESTLEWAILGFHHELVELSLQSITARGYQSSRLDTTIRQYMLYENKFWSGRPRVAVALIFYCQSVKTIFLAILKSCPRWLVRNCRVEILNVLDFEMC